MWSHGYCPDCDIYKGNGGLCPGYPVEPKDTDQTIFEALGHSGCWLPMDEPAKDAAMPTVKLTLIDAEYKTSRPCDLEEARTWDWGNPDIMRIVGKWHIKDFDMLLFILREKQDKGIQEVDIFEAPRFMVLAGG
jgi:hypothetical protein